MNSEQIKRIADAYIAAPHTPGHIAYQRFVEETLEQYRALTSLPLKVWIIPTRGYDVAYRSSVDMFHDLSTYNRLVVSTDGSPFAPHHPLNTKHYGPIYGGGTFETALTANTKFRAVHDYFGHYLGRHPFEAFEGEIAAYQEHARRYSPEALPALYSETVAQLCYFYAYGSFVPVQKAAILPVEVFA
jgi:hypothetical protein